jgi:hypothetical protein
MPTSSLKRASGDNALSNLCSWVDAVNHQSGKEQAVRFVFAQRFA